MGKGKKSFIDRKNAVTFHLVHRSQRDPLAADESAPQHVLMEAQPKQKEDPNKKDELKKYGIFFDDDYNYLQHLKEPVGEDVVWEYVENPNQPKTKAERRKLQLPSSVFQSEVEEDEGLLNKAAPRPGPRPDLDPDVVAALDDDFDFSDPENALDDDFMAQAMDGEDDCFDEDEEYDEEEERSDIDSDGQMYSDDEEGEEELMDRLGPLMRKDRFQDEETKSRFTEYSMTSSVIRRNEQLSLLDDRFEAFYASYDDPELGPLDMEEIEGTWGQKHPLVLGCYKQYKNSGKMEEYNKKWDKERIKKFENEINSDDDMVDMEVSEDGDKQKKWDCESILSTYSNIYNHPKLINEPRRKRKNVIEIDPKTGIPMNTLGSGGDKLTVKALAKLDAETDAKESGAGPKSLCAKSVMSTLSVLSIRPKDESAEEKKERKKLLKEYRLERRIEKKANAEAFKEEKKRQVHIKINKQNNIQGNKIV
ncbi:LTV1 family protein [Megaselia abdita]